MNEKLNELCNRASLRLSNKLRIEIEGEFPLIESRDLLAAFVSHSENSLIKTADLLDRRRS